MSHEDQKKEIINSLKKVTTLLRNCSADYRFLGSVLIVSYSGKLYRHIADVDVMLERKSKDCLFEALANNEFKIIKKNWLSFSWFEATKPNYLGLTFLLIGDFEENFFRYKISKNLELRINNDYLKSTIYHYGGVSFIGIPLSSAIAGIKQSFLNPKRKHDRILLQNKMKERVKIFDNINVYYKDIKLPYLYDFFRSSTTYMEP